MTTSPALPAGAGPPGSTDLGGGWLLGCEGVARRQAAFDAIRPLDTRGEVDRRSTRRETVDEIVRSHRKTK